MAPAQAQAQAQSTITHTESLELVRCLLRVSVFHISYLRGLFPDNFYKGVDMKNLEGMHIKMLQACDDESQRLIDWVDAGVYDAIRVGYLKTLFFGVATDPKGSNLLEEYIFNFSYGNGGVSMDVQQKTKAGRTRAMKASGSHQVDIEDVKYHVTRLMRMLVQICQTLEQMPKQRYLFMKLMYHENAPDSYDPPFFKSLPESEGVGHFSRKPFSMVVGDVATKHHGVTLKVKSTLDCCGDADGDAGAVDPELVESANQQPSSSAMDQDDGTSKAPMQHDSDITMPDQAVPGRGSNEPTSKEIPEELYSSVKKYVQGCFESFSQVELVDAMGFFLDAHPNHISAAFVRMQQEGILVADASRQDTFRPVIPKAAAPAAEAAQAMMAKLGVREDASQRGDIRALGSDATGTGSVLPTLGHQPQHNLDSQPFKPVYFDAGLQSGAQQGSARKTRARKASFVEEPIYQANRSGGTKRPKRVVSAAATAAAATAETAGTAKQGRGRK